MEDAASIYQAMDSEVHDPAELYQLQLEKSREMTDSAGGCSSPING
jgi:hypothetical protein